MTPFAEPNLSLCDGRDLFIEIVGKDAWQQDMGLYKIILLLPDFIEDMLAAAPLATKHVFGKFHLG